MILATAPATVETMANFGLPSERIWVWCYVFLSTVAAVPICVAMVFLWDAVSGVIRKTSKQQFPGHKDGAVSERWAEALAKAGYRPVVVEAGIHYDNLSREGIMDVIRLTDEILLELSNCTVTTEYLGKHPFK